MVTSKFFLQNASNIRVEKGDKLLQPLDFKLPRSGADIKFVQNRLLPRGIRRLLIILRQLQSCVADNNYGVAGTFLDQRLFDNS
jgi:hypothetical protein